jgi:hypothetical protein
MPLILSLVIHLGLIVGTLLMGAGMPGSGDKPLAEQGEGDAPQVVEVIILPKPRAPVAELREEEQEEDPMGILLKQAPHLNDKCEPWYGGVGLTHIKDPDGNIMVVEVNPGYPAHIVGVRPGDFLTREMVRSLRGVPGTPVRIDIVRQGFPMSFQTVRDRICTSGP